MHPSSSGATSSSTSNGAESPPRLVTCAVIPAAGLGTRLLPLTRSQAKEMVACGSCPVIGHVLEELRIAGIRRIVLVSRAGKSSLEDYVFSEWPGACVIRQPEPKGLGDAVMQARLWVGDEPFVVANGDTIVTGDGEVHPLRRLVESCQRECVSGVLVREVSEQLLSLYGVVQPRVIRPEGEWFAVSDIIEKPAPSEAPSRLAIAGRYVFTPAIFDAIGAVSPDSKGEIQLAAAMRSLCSRAGLYASRMRPTERRFDIGNFATYYEAFEALSRANPADVAARRSGEALHEQATAMRKQ